MQFRDVEFDLVDQCAVRTAINPRALVVTSALDHCIFGEGHKAGHRRRRRKETDRRHLVVEKRRVTNVA
ncbi:hypothetical protein CVO77_00780 [Sphingopyxis lindanitolerans]|uniref:Uncharacterized protein n=1 Tax=Sphingopyxis lindanitolerans TaxID=2054227 RepID=A0A2S8BB00_9SPHN|nr:hypothetical protein [Sphingopyxis lindanitolerans]PQM29493.1 hypothetical protein CVO77_00780 [Sphingopyxis lindanitolerans]